MRLTNEDFEKAAQVKAIIEKEIQKHYTIGELAHLVGTNECKLKVAFKAVTENTIYDYLTITRIEKAKYYLENTELPVKFIARKVGLDKSNLSKQFKKLTGKTPLVWRREHEEENRFFRKSG